jgi:hypothetical protein
MASTEIRSFDLVTVAEFIWIKHVVLMNFQISG